MVDLSKFISNRKILNEIIILFVTNEVKYTCIWKGKI